MIAVKGHTNLARDPRSGAIINMSAGKVHSANRAKLAEERKVQEDRLNKVEEDVSEIKDMLKQLIER
jgi:hypothetical protein|tara:strand:+ start:549 stop:749 length:201 start_codon:yes stop_codon:yes gene_type:complete